MKKFLFISLGTGVIIAGSIGLFNFIKQKKTGCPIE